MISEISGDQVLNSFKGDAGLYYKEFPGSIAIGAFLDGGSPFYRFSGMYDEPGVIGTISGLFLLIERFSLSNWTNRLLLIGGIVSFSLAFVGILLLYCVLSFKWRFLASMMLFFLVIYFFLPIGIQEVINNQFLGRLTVSSGMIQDNRSTPNLVYYWDLRKSSDTLGLLFGLGIPVVGDIGSSWKIVVIKQGIFGILILWLWLSIYALRTYLGWIRASLLRRDGLKL